MPRHVTLAVDGQPDGHSQVVERGVCGRDVERRARALACDVCIVCACMWTGRAGQETLVADFDFFRWCIHHPGPEGVNGLWPRKEGGGMHIY